jgi:fructokinase
VRIGIDLGGTKIEGMLLGRAGEEGARRRVATPPQGYQAVLDAVVNLVKDLEAEAALRPGQATVGVATPGFLAPADGLIRNSNLASLNGRPVDKDLSALLGRPVRVENDATCFVLSEAADGAAARPAGATGTDVVFGATLGTGIGGGIAIDGRPWGGANGAAAEWSHTTLPFHRASDGPGAACVCSAPSCIEAFLAGKGLVWDHRHHGGEELPAAEIGRRAEAGDAAAVATFERYEDRLARALAGVINLLDPRVIVLGGGISTHERLYREVPRLWERYTVARGLVTRLVPAKHGDASGVRGAAWLW